MASVTMQERITKEALSYYYYHFHCNPFVVIPSYFHASEALDEIHLSLLSLSLHPSAGFHQVQDVEGQVDSCD